jgi:hypothetical protein
MHVCMRVQLRICPMPIKTVCLQMGLQIQTDDGEPAGVLMRLGRSQDRSRDSAGPFDPPPKNSADCLMPGPMNEWGETGIV